MEVLNPGVISIIEQLQLEEELIDTGRKIQLKELAELVQSDSPPSLLFVCTHNSRRSQLAELWARVLAHYHKLNISSFSAGTEATAFHPNMIKALKSTGFELISHEAGENPIYMGAGQEMFSKRLDHQSLPSAHFIAVMVCSDADSNCPLVPGAEKRISLTYDDPKAFDGTELEEAAYLNKVREIGRELCYLFKQIQILP